jgi:hypothetical protein
MLLLPYRVFDGVFADSTRSWFVGVCSSSVLSNRRGDDSSSKRRGEDACDKEILGDTTPCEADDDGCTELMLPILEGAPRRMPTDTILAAGDIVMN